VTKDYKVFLWVLVAGAGLVVILKYLFPLMAPFLLGTIFACLIEPVVKRLDTRLRVGRKLTIMLILIFLVIVAFSITGFSVLAFYQEAQRLMPKIPGLVERLLNITQEILNYLVKYFPQMAENGPIFALPRESIGRVLRSMIIGGLQFLPRFPQLLLAIGLGGVTAYFFSRDKELISRVFYQILPYKWQKATITLKTEVMASVSRFIRTECILALVTTSLTTVFFLCLGIPAAMAYGFLAGMLDFLPVLGPGLIYIPLVAVNLLFGNYYQALWLTSGYFILLLLRQITEYKLIGENLNLHPLVSIFVIYIGVQIFGVAGIFLGPLLIVILRAFYRVLMGTRKVVDG
jgi:sporulation integral membrane protein YtvI